MKFHDCHKLEHPQNLFGFPSFRKIVLNSRQSNFPIVVGLEKWCRTVVVIDEMFWGRTFQKWFYFILKTSGWHLVLGSLVAEDSMPRGIMSSEPRQWKIWYSASWSWLCSAVLKINPQCLDRVGQHLNRFIFSGSSAHVLLTT